MRTLLSAVVVLVLAGCGTRLGDPCETHFACGSGNMCDLSSVVPDGYCTRTPCRNLGCADSEDAVCIVFVNGESFCMRECVDSDDCAGGQQCLPAAAACDGSGPCVDGGMSASYCYATP